MTSLKHRCLFAVMTLTVAVYSCFAGSAKPDPANLSRSQVIKSTMKPFTGTVASTRVDSSTMDRKVMCGYQGWFTCPNDGSGRGWFHWGKGVFEPGNCTIDLWPDMTEYGDDEKCPTSFKHADNSPAFVYSAMNSKSVARHFKWMRDYGIDGVFVQRFVTETLGNNPLLQANTVLDNCRAGANEYGRTYAVMYDMSGLKKGQTRELMEDWKLLVDNMKISRDPNDKAYQFHKGKPVIAIWGIGFEGRDYTLDECSAMIDFFKNDPRYGYCTIMVGIPTYWRTLKNDSVTDKKLHEIVLKSDIVSPWMVGRVRNLADVDEFAFVRIWKPDIEWCKEHGKDYLPVVFPGFSWTNLKRDPQAFNSIPRLGGKFLWHQYFDAMQCGSTMIYQAMFDEVDEGTAIYKCTSNPPVGKSKFLTYEGLPSDHYLWLVGQAAKMLRGEIPVNDQIPARDKK
jgi:hypothetical protein